MDTHFEWHFLEQNKPTNAFLIRYEQVYAIYFHNCRLISCLFIWDINNDTVYIYEPINISISESEISFPNAFSPNGDGIMMCLKLRKVLKVL